MPSSPFVRIEDFVRFFSPFSYDRNHMSRAGLCHTVFGLDIASADQGKAPLTGEMDLRRASVAFRMRTRDLFDRGNGIRLFVQTILSSGDINIVSPWMTEPVEIKTRERWFDLVFSFDDVVSFAGNNEKENSLQWKYAEASKEETLKNHRGTIALTFNGGEIPEGMLDFYSVHLC